MEFDSKVWKEEKSRLKRVLEVINIQLERSRGALDVFRKQVIRTQKSMWDEVNPTPNDMDDLANVWQYQVDIEREGRKAIFEGKQAARLEKLQNSPYFGRIDFNEDDSGEVEKIYIGIANLFDEKSSEYLTYDWRAPISSMFYDFETGRARYKCPAGIIEGQLELKRQYRIWRGELEYMFDSSLKIDDEVLQEILSKSADSKMRTIVTSIQREQNKVIRDDTSRLLIVQGAAGSGKTSIALHRAAYLLYRYKDEVKAENIAIFSPNQLFNDYISNVLPELGEENMRRTTFMQYGQSVLGKFKVLEDANRQMEFILSGINSEDYGIRMAGIRFKAATMFTELLKKYAKYIENSRSFEDITYGDVLVEAGSEIDTYFRRDMATLPVSMRLEKIKNRLFSLLDPLIRKRAEEIIIDLADSGEYVDKDEMKARSLLMAREEMSPLKEKIDKMTAFNLLAYYTSLFENEKILKILAEDVTEGTVPGCRKNDKSFEKPAECNLPDEIDGICKYTAETVNSGKIYYEDLGPVLFLKGMLEGCTGRGDIRHVIIDEIQDYTPAQFEVLKQLFGQSNITMLGDISQSINPYMNMGNYENIASIMGNNKTSFISLSKSYRSTRQITEFCRALLSATDETDYVNRDGELPQVITLNESKNPYNIIAEMISELSGKGCGSIAVICRTERDCELMYEGIKGQAKARLLHSSDEEFSVGTLIMPSYMAKGLEFDGVIIYDEGSGGYDREEERKLLYTACTRALHNLRVVCKVRPSRFISSVNGALYETRML